MNKDLHRIVFNQARGMLMATAESACSHNRSDARRRQPGTRRRNQPVQSFRLAPGALALLMTLSSTLGAVNTAHAQIVTDPTAPQNQRPTVTTAANGVPLINIQAPSAGGVSRNTYSQFDVQQNGVILNNARANAQTQLGGWIQGNANLAGGTARIILNEVNSSNPSLLRGYVEVGGDRAQVVIANPAGVTCDGCGFINATRATLTTGTPIFTGGNLDGFRVERGQIVIQGNGLDATQADYTDLIARSVQINAGLWANQIKVTTGANQVSTDNSQATPIAGAGAAPALAIDVAQLGGMYAGKIILVGTEAGVGVRNAGQIGASAGDVAITVDGQLTNRGTVTALGNVSLNATRLDNQGAKIQATGDIAVALGNGQLDNSGGLLRANQALSVSAGTITNSTTQGTEQGLEGHSVVLTAAQIANDDGAIRADLGITITSGGTLDNTRGLIAGQTLQILDPNRVVAASKTLAITNTGGTLFASQNLTIDAASLTGDGNLYALNDLSLSLNSAFSNAGQIVANHDVTLFTTGLLSNSGALKAGNKLTLAAANLNNAATGEISALETQLGITNTFDNRGLIDGSKTAITAGTVNNLGSGRIYGGTLSIATTTLNNTNGATSPTIAARQRLDLGVTTLYNDNGGLIFSSGDLAIGGSLDSNRLASGRAGTITNNGGTIQALGALAITAGTIINSNANFTATTVASGSPVYRTVYYTSLGTFTEDQIAAKYDSGVWGNLLSNAGNPNSSANSTISFTLNPTVANPNGGTGGYTGALTVYNYLVESYQPLAVQVQSSAPGQLISGGNMMLDASNTLTNDKSRIIAGGALNILGQSVNNIAAQVSATEYHAGTNYSWRYAGHDGKSTGHHCDCDFYAFVGGGYAANIGVTLDASITAVLDHQSAGSGTAIPTRANTSATQIATPAIPNNSLYHVLPAANSHVLVETDPRFANYRTWLSSDYMQQQLGLDPTVSQKRLGDGFYEQQLIREQIGQLTGQRFLTGYASDEAQYQSLMNAAVTQAQAFNLHLGVALSAAQIAQLTSDIVWLVEQSVTLPDGSTQKVLVPQVYLLPRSGDLKADGTLIAGQTVAIRAGGDFVNSGTVAGRTLLDLSAANVQNLGGRLTGAAVNISASNDITNLGGRIEAQDSLALTAGRDINIETTTATGTGQTEQGNFSRTQIDRVAGLYVTGSSGTLSAVAGRNMTLTAAEVVNAGSGTTTLAAGNDLTLGTVTTRDVIDIGGNSRNHVQVNASSEVGTRLRTEGDANLIAGNDLLGRAVDLEAQGNLALTAGNDVVLAAGRNEQTIDIASYSSGRSGGGLMGGKKVTRSLEIKAETSTAQEGTLSGKNVSIQAGQDIALEGGQYTAKEKLALDAGRDLLIAAASDSLQGSQNLSNKNGAKVKQQSEQLSSNTATGAILVAGSDLSLKSTRDTTLVATALAAENTVAIQSGGDLNLQTAQSDRQVQSTDYDQGKKKAVTHTREEAETRQLLSTITAGSGLDISVGGNFSAEVAEKNADGSLKADRMTATGVEQGDSRQQVSITGTGSGGGSLAESAKKALANGIRADANDAFTAGATASGAAALSQYLQSGLVQIKQDPQLAGKIQQVLDSSAGTTLTVKDDAGHVSLTVAGQAKVQEVYNTLKLSENFDVKKFADQGTAQIVTLIAAIVITIYTGGAGAGTLGAAIAGAGANAATIAIINAAIIGMSSTMIGQLAGGASFDKAFQAGLKAGATSALMAGVAAGVSSMVNGSAASSTANTTTSIDSGSQNLQLGNSGTATTATSSIKLDTLMSANYWQQTGLNALAKGALTKAQGGKFEDGLIGSVVGSLAASGAGIVGGLTQDNTLANIVSHAVLGCAVAAASNQDCGSGALGGAASASLARVIDSSLGKDNLSDGDPNDPNRKAIIAAGAVTGSMAIAAATGKDVLTTGNAAANEVVNNYLTHRQIQDKKSELGKAATDEERKQVEQKYTAIDKQQQQAAADCLLNGNCGSVTMNSDTLKRVLAELYASCAPPRLCSADAVSSIKQLNGLLDKAEGISKVYPVESLAAFLSTGGLSGFAGRLNGISTGMRVAGGVIGAGANYSFQDNNQPVDGIDLAIAGITGYLSTGRTLWPSATINSSGALIGSTIKGENPYPAVTSAALGTIVGYGAGKAVEIPLNNKLNPWYRSDWIKGYLEISRWNAPNLAPPLVGNATSSFFQEPTGNAVKSAIVDFSKPNRSQP
ncbi:filamentous hemagglutinin N-terminal domain-containing protein [Azonexus sp. IMCC34842]|uniref:two-partner secretion domain-containing protein n=1 Tax=Azonexus sp. IMCC34842 TaxID=3420950 RepID=UPI003D14F66B